MHILNKAGADPEPARFNIPVSGECLSYYVSFKGIFTKAFPTAGS
jgi:hypothetical protein